MEKVTIQIDWYTKAVLTLIAVLLAGLLVKPYMVGRPAGAYSSEQAEPVPVEVTAINLHWTDYMPVKVMNWPKDKTK